MSIKQGVMSLGFDLGRLNFAFRTTLAAGLALLLAWALGLEHPQWAAMSVWAASQPLRGQLVEKGLYRVLGSVVGAAVGVILLLSAQVHPALLVCGLALWLGLCTWGANLQIGLRGYGLSVAGFTAAMVALLDYAHPDQVLWLGADRLATVLVGVLVATGIGAYFAKASAKDGMRGEALPLLSDALRLHLAPAPTHHAANQLLGRIALLDEGLEPQAAGSVRSRQMVRATRRLLLAIVPLLLGRFTSGPAQDQLNAPLFTQAIAAIKAQDLGLAAERLDGLQLSGNGQQNFDTLKAALRGLAGVEEMAPSPAVRASKAVILHRDWIGAREAGLRAGGTLLVFGLAWVVSGWSMGAYMLLGLSVILSVFSGFENPSAMMRQVILGQGIAAGTALICHNLLWPLAQSELQMILMMFPFMLAGIFLNSHRRTYLAALDFHMVFLLLCQPRFPYAANFPQSLTMVAAVAAAPVIALGVYMLIFPVNLARRREHLMQMMYRDLADLSASASTLDNRLSWEARLYHRALRLIRLSGRLQAEETRALELSRATLLLGHKAMEWQRAVADPQTTPRVRRVLLQALARLAQVQDAPSHAKRSLQRLGAYLPDPLARSLQEASQAISALD